MKKLENERMKLEIEKQKTLESEKLERSERDKDRDRAAEMERLDREKVAAMERSEREREKAAEMEKMRLEMEHELKLRQFETSRVDSDGREEVIEGDAGEDGERPVRVHASKWDETLDGRTKRFGDTLQHVVPKLPMDISQNHHYFENVEHLFDIYEVPADLRSKLLIPICLRERNPSSVG